ncbi:MAG: HNH endonuclease [Candidatus Eremiobacteraeota bacterium]|nr:HNH endonuclease [Candidatus Eremiobacteraeota bacterium]
MRRLHDWNEIQQYHDAGHGFVECRRNFGFSHTAWIKALKRGELIARFRSAASAPVCDADRRRIYNWTEIQKFYDAGHTYRECREKSGFAAMSWHKARLRGGIRTRPHAIPIDRLLAAKRTRPHVKRRLLEAGILKNVCDECGLSEWQRKPLSMHIDHINGTNDDHRLENLRMLCPNCHSQTATYAGRNKRLKRARRRDENLV